MLSALQERVALLVADLIESSGFALAGGGALIARGDVDRTTRDLDYFATRPEQVLELLPRLEQALRGAGLEVDRVRATDGFARLLVTDAGAVTELDLASDFRLLPPERTPFGLTLAGEELAVDKVLALFDRAEARDFVDLAAVVDRWGLDHLCRLAPEKDRGFDRNVLAAQLGRFDRLPAASFRLPAEEVERLRNKVRSWQDELRRPSA